MTTRFVSPGLGYEIEERPHVHHEGAAKNQKLQRAISEMGNVPGFDGSNRTPVTYGADGLPNVPEYVEKGNMEARIHQLEEQVRQQEAAQEHANLAGSERAHPGIDPHIEKTNFKHAQDKEKIPLDVLKNSFPEKHPVVERLLAKFGVVNQKHYEFSLFSSESDSQGTKFTLSPISDDLAAWCLEVTRAELAKDSNIGVAYYESLLCCSCILALDGVPVYEAFSIRQTEEERIKQANSPLLISSRVRKISGQKLMDIFWSETKPVLMKLTEFYEQTITKDTTVRSSLDIKREELERYVCPIDGCNVFYYESPAADDGEEQHFYCKSHAAPMVKTLMSAKAGNYPLA